MFNKDLLPKIRNTEVNRRLYQIEAENEMLKNMGIEYREKMALEKEQKPRYLFGKKIVKCNDCPRVWKNFRKDGENFCAGIGRSISNLNEMCRMCPLPLFKNEGSD